MSDITYLLGYDSLRCVITFILIVLVSLVNQKLNGFPLDTCRNDGKIKASENDMSDDGYRAGMR